jgi:hypothetical protein
VDLGQLRPESRNLRSERGGGVRESLSARTSATSFGSTRVPGTPQNLAAVGLPDEYLDFDIVTKRNAGKAGITGIEGGYRQSFGFLPAWGRGLQAFFNVTSMASARRQSE